MRSRNSFTELISSCRINSACGYSVEETCPYCSAPVHFESADVAICRDKHTLTRCRASMILCSVLQPVWHCVCCGGMVDKLLPQSFFAMQASPLPLLRHSAAEVDAGVPAVHLAGVEFSDQLAASVTLVHYGLVSTSLSLV
jgi:hypothetical protein